MKVVVLIPAYNEALLIGNVIKNIPKNFIDKVEILVIDDGSTDNTSEIAKKAGADKVIKHNKNLGLGIAFRHGLEAALLMNADIIVNIDADGQFDPKDIPKLVNPIIKKEADMVTCSRFLDKNFTQEGMPFIKKIGNKLFTSLINLMTRKKFTDTQCGFRAYSRDAALKMTLFGDYTYTQEVFLDLVEKNMLIKEIPCKVVRRKGKSKLVSGVFSYGFKALAILIRSIRDYRPLKFFGSIGIFTFIVGFIINSILLIRLIIINQIYPFLSLVYIATVLMVLGFLLIILALIADMLDRQRKILEEILYEARLRKK